MKFKLGETVKVKDKHSKILMGMEKILRIALGNYIKEYREQLVDIDGGAENAIITVVGKMFCSLVALGVYTSGTDLNKAKKNLFALLDAQIDKACLHYQTEGVEAANEDPL